MLKQKHPISPLLFVTFGSIMLIFVTLLMLKDASSHPIKAAAASSPSATIIDTLRPTVTLTSTLTPSLVLTPGGTQLAQTAVKVLALTVQAQATQTWISVIALAVKNNHEPF